jgi:hypothetical protein
MQFTHTEFEEIVTSEFSPSLMTYKNQILKIWELISFLSTFWYFFNYVYMVPEFE